MPYGINLGNPNKETGMPDLNPYPKAGSEQGTLIPNNFIAPLPKPHHQSPISTEQAIVAARASGVFSLDQ